MPWHLTPIENIEAIQRDGLRPSIGRLSQEVGETEALVHLFSTFGDLQSADWLWDAFDDDAKLALYHVALPAAEGAWTELQDGVPTESLRLMSLDAGSISEADVIRALEALDRVVDPLGSVDDFRKTRVAVRASSFGQLIKISCHKPLPSYRIGGGAERLATLPFLTAPWVDPDSAYE